MAGSTARARWLLASAAWLPALVAAMVAAITWPGADARADESTLALAEDPARTQVVAACSACHSVDYVLMNSPFQDRAGWEKTVTKMIKVMGAPIAPEDAATIVDYLSRHYGPATPGS